MLCLKCETKPGWIISALADIESVIIDHAHCEKKAASTGLSLLSAYPDKIEISLAMSDLIEEEISHYRDVVKILNWKGVTLRKDNGDPYVKELLSYLNPNEPERMLDRLLTAGIIEARSCERLQILADNLNDPDLKYFYKKLSDSEAGHYVTFIKLAKLYFNEDEVKQRLDELAEIEKNIVLALPDSASMHG
ncbi:MAG: tRNA-(ms[2]io[6]A)-hydroxylase [Ignavibacteriaceae bacterium]